MTISRRKFLRNSLAAAVATAIPVSGYAQFIEPHHLTVGRVELPIRNLPDAFDGFRIAQLSDLHYFPFTSGAIILSAVRLANSLSPDLVVLTGDFITADRGPVPPTDPVFSHMAVCAEMLSGLHAPAGVFACPGNHDTSIGIQYVRAVLADFSIPLLRNENHAVERGGARIWLSGLDDAIYGGPDYRAALAGIPAGETIVMIAHEPDLADMTCNHPVAVQLSGHSHGGQVRLPIIGCPFLPHLARKYPYGYYRVRDLHLYTNRGIGEIVLPYRFNAPPEVTLATLRVAR